MTKIVDRRRDQKVNLIFIKNQSLIIVQLKQPIPFAEILDKKNLKEFTKNYLFYENNHLIKRHYLSDVSNYSYTINLFENGVM
jgi:hypothetical protein